MAVCRQSRAAPTTPNTMPKRASFRQLNGPLSPSTPGSIADAGNRLEVGGVGSASVAIQAVEGDATAELMGLVGSAVPVRPFSALLDLREALENGDCAAVRSLLPELEALEHHFTATRGTLGNRLNLAEDAQSTLETRNFNMTAALS